MEISLGISRKVEKSTLCLGYLSDLLAHSTTFRPKFKIGVLAAARFVSLFLYICLLIHFTEIEEANIPRQFLYGWLLYSIFHFFARGKF